MIFDSLSILLLFLACIAAWWLSRAARAPARIPVRFAAILFAALAAACALGWFGLPALALVVALIALSLGGTALGLFAALARPVPPLAAALGLTLALFAGVAAALAAIPAYALGAAMLALSLLSAMSLSVFSWRPDARLWFWARRFR